MELNERTARLEVSMDLLQYNQERHDAFIMELKTVSQDTAITLREFANTFDVKVKFIIISFFFGGLMTAISVIINLLNLMKR